jgi:hypothetical protein
MIKPVLIFCVFLAWKPVFSQQPAARDTLPFSFSLADRHLGDTSYAHGTGTTTFLRFFNKNLHIGDTAVLGAAIVYFIIDRSGRCVEAHYDSASSERQIAQEVLRVVNRMNDYLPMAPTTINGRPVVSLVRAQVVFREEGKSGQAPFRPDIEVVLYPVQY